MTRNQILLGVAALVLVGFSLFVALVVPRFSPEFPGRGLRFFVVLSILLVAGMLASVEVFGEEGEGESAKAQEERADTGGVDTGKTVTAPTTTAGGATKTGSEQPQGDAAAGKQVFLDSGCGGCHTLADAGTSGTVGPNLDDLQPSFDAAVKQVTNGGGGMPAFGGKLSDEQIRNVAAYVASATSK